MNKPGDNFGAGVVECHSVGQNKRTTNKRASKTASKVGTNKRTRTETPETAPTKRAHTKANKACDIIGVWDVDFPEISTNYRDGDFSISFDSKLQGSFDFGILEGAVKLQRIGANQFTFKWRGRETGEGEIQLGSDQEGSITVNGDKLTGIMKGPYLGSKGSPFTAVRVSHDAPRGEVCDFDFYTHEQYEYERTARWR